MVRKEDPSQDRLRIDSIEAGGGVIGLTFCPGKHDVSASGRIWARDLKSDVEEIQRWGAQYVISILERDEFSLLNVPDLGACVRALGLDWQHLPIADQSIPSRTFMAKWADLSTDLQRRLAAGDKIIFHCRGGLGRTGLVAALLLMDLGWGSEDAIQLVREVRSPRAIETREQEDFIRRYPVCLLNASIIGGALGFHRVRELAGDQALGDQLSFASTMPSTLYTMEALVRAQICQKLNGRMPIVDIVDRALLRLLKAQAGEVQMAREEQTALAGQALTYSGEWIATPEALALQKAQRSGHMACNDNRDCGALTRIAPLAFAMLPDPAAKIAGAIAALTHGHPVSQIAASAWYDILIAAARRYDLASCAHNITRRLQGISREADIVSWAIRDALNAPRDAGAETLSKFGEGRYAEEAIAIALYAALSGSDFDAALDISARHFGNSEGASILTGQLLGLLYPQRTFSYPKAPVFSDLNLVTRLTTDVIFASHWSQDEAERQWKFYPGY